MSINKQEMFGVFSQRKKIVRIMFSKCLLWSTILLVRQTPFYFIFYFFRLKLLAKSTLKEQFKAKNKALSSLDFNSLKDSSLALPPVSAEPNNPQRDVHP